MFEGKPSASEGPKLEETTPEVLAKIGERIRAAATATGMAEYRMSDSDVRMVATYVALKAEKTGTPYTLDSVGSIDQGLLTQALQERIEAKGMNGPGHMVIGPDGNVIGKAADMAEAGRMTEHERNQGV